MKISKSHTTATETTKNVIKTLSKLECVDKISIGIIKNTKSKTGQQNLKMIETKSGLKISVRGNGAVQELYVYTKKPKEVKENL